MLSFSICYVDILSDTPSKVCSVQLFIIIINSGRDYRRCSTSMFVLLSVPKEIESTCGAPCDKKHNQIDLPHGEGVEGSRYLTLCLSVPTSIPA